MAVIKEHTFYQMFKATLKGIKILFFSINVISQISKIITLLENQWHGINLNIKVGIQFSDDALRDVHIFDQKQRPPMDV